MHVRGIFETHLMVANLARSVAFYRDVVGLPSHSRYRSAVLRFTGSGSRDTRCPTR